MCLATLLVVIYLLSTEQNVEVDIAEDGGTGGRGGGRFDRVLGKQGALVRNT